MSAVVVFIIFAICLVIAIPISISLGIVAVLPGAFDASFTASAGYVIRSMVEESTVSRCLQCQCSCLLESLWRTVKFQKNYLMYLFISLETKGREYHVQ